jgi:biopolymer transport protein ExbD
MSSNAGFKQLCPHCQVALLLRDPSWIGKTVECPKCKNRFLVEDPAKKTAPPELSREEKEALIRKDREAVRGAQDGSPAPGNGVTVKTAPSVKPQAPAKQQAARDKARFDTDPLFSGGTLAEGSHGRRGHRKAAKSVSGGVNLGIIITPMLDMAFQLLAFFIMTYHPSALEGHIDGNLLPPSKPAIVVQKDQKPDPNPPPPKDADPEKEKDKITVVLKAVGGEKAEGQGEGARGMKYKKDEQGEYVKDKDGRKLLVPRELGDLSRVFVKTMEDPTSADPKTAKPVMDTDVVLEDGLKHVGQYLKKLQEKTGGNKIDINLDPDGDLKHGWVIAVYDLCKGANFQNVGFIAPPPDAAATKKGP